MKRNTQRRAIGGDFPVERPPEAAASDDLWPPGTWTVSGRSALTLLLEARKPAFTHIQLPAFVCESVVSAVEEAGFRYSFFDVDKDLRGEPNRDPQSLALQLHYFGEVTEWDSQALGIGGIIEDYSMAVPAIRGTRDLKNDAFFSARKFGPVPLGGWASLSRQLESYEQAGEVEKVSILARQDKWRYLQESGALQSDLEAAYLEKLGWAESELANLPKDCAFPELSRRLFVTIDWDSLGSQRRSNWQQLTAGLRDRYTILNPFPGPSSGTVPLGLVLRLPSGRDHLRSKLMRERVYCPVHWPLPVQVNEMEFPLAASLAATVLTIPLDQRYSSSDMDFVIDSLLEHGEKS